MISTPRSASLSTRLRAQGRYELVAMLKNGEQLMLNIAFPMMALYVMSWTSFLDSFAQKLQSTRIDIAVPGVLALCVISTALSGQGIATGFDRRYGVLRFLSTTPLGKTGLIVGKVCAVLGVLCLQYILVVLVALTLGWSPQWGAVVASLPTLLLGAASFTSLGLLIAGTVRAEATLAIVNMAWAVLAAVGGTLLPTHHLPSVLGRLVDILPSGALGNALRAEFLTHEFALIPHLVLLMWTALCIGLATKFFRWSA
ncbi:ABC transporter permease [Rothia sp. P7208]|uniref:ABC transporter permease n=1 Tax=Rothia sp. P7208 TaxID=3402660 RepID=UPI003ACFF1BC